MRRRSVIGPTAHPLVLLVDTWWTRRQGQPAWMHRQRARLAAMVAFARANSPYYRELYQALPDRVDRPEQLPVTEKKTLMACFDDWVTDREVTLDKTRPFVENPDLFGAQLLGRYSVVTTSGTTGRHGIFVIDRPSLAVTASMFLRMLGSWLGPADVLSIMARRGRLGLVFATGTPLATGVAITRLGERLGKAVRAFSVRAPLPEIVAGLNDFQPAVLSSYATVMKLLANEQQAGRLRMRPVLIVLTAEGAALAEYDRIATVFGSEVGNTYAASECPFLSSSCAHRWLHVNSDWVVLEPVDADYRPTPPGEQSHTVLLSNLANRVQPILRYDLGDSVMQRPDPCPCGNPLPAIRVQGRAADVLVFPGDHGQPVTLAPLLIGASLYHIPGIEQVQLVQTAPTSVRLRLRRASKADPDRVWAAAHTAIRDLLNAHGLGMVSVERAEEPPEQTPGGKYREVIPLG